MTRYTVTRCPGCGRRLGVNGVDIHRLSPGAPAPESRQRPIPRVVGGLFETPRDGRESSQSDSPLGRSRSRSSQAASPQPSVVRGSTD